MSDSLWRHGLQHARLPCPPPSPRVCWNSYLLNWWCHPAISSSVVPFSCLQCFPASGSFPVSWFFTSSGQSVGPSPGIKPRSLALQADSLPAEPPGKPHFYTKEWWTEKRNREWEKRERWRGKQTATSERRKRRRSFQFFSQATKVKSLSHVHLFATPWTAAYQAPLPTGFSRQEYWSGGAISFSRDLPDPGMELRSPALQADTLPSEPPGKLSSYWRLPKTLQAIKSTQTIWSNDTLVNI